MKKLIQISLLLGVAHLAFADNKASQGGNQGSQGGNQGPQGDEKGSHDLPPAASSAWVDVIIQFNKTSSGAALQGQLNGLENMLMQFAQNAQQQQGQHGDKVLNSINALHLKIPAALLPWLKANPAVKYISPDRPTAKFLDLTAAAVNASVAWQSGFDGTGVGVAVIDSGIMPKHDLTANNGVTSRIVFSQNFATGMTDASDGYGHGTHVAGIIGSAGRDSTGAAFKRTFKGIAPNVNLINLRVLDQNGAGLESDVISAIQQAINLKNVYNIRVINLSLGRPVFESYKLDPLCQAVEAAWQAGIVVVTAAGNFGRDNSMGTDGYGTIASPGNDPYVITVGAMKTNHTAAIYDDTIASYSSKGPTLGDHVVKPDLVAPGNQVISLLAPNSTLANYPNTLVSNSTFETIGGNGTSGNYFMLSGTSMATPVVSGAAALLIQQHPTLTPDQVKARLMKTALKPITLYSTGTDAQTLRNYNSQADIFTIGAGYLNIAAALTNNDLTTLPALSPVATRNPTTHKTVILRGAGTWGDSVLWGDGAVYGNIVFTHTALFSLDENSDVSVLWGDTVIWGQDDSVLWGDSVNGTSALSALSAGDDDL